MVDVWLPLQFIKKNFDAELLFTDTNSLTYEIKSIEVYEELFKHKNLFDFSNYPKDSKLFDPTNKKVIGKMKDEKEGKITDEFLGLKSTMYSMKNIDGKESNTAKGVNIAIEFHEFKDVLFNKKIIRHKMRRIQNKKHKIGTYQINKISLSCFDDKRLVQDDEIHTLAYFHKDLKNRFSRMKKSCHEEEEIQKDSHKKRDSKRFSLKRKDSYQWSQITISPYKENIHR